MRRNILRYPLVFLFVLILIASYPLQLVKADGETSSIDAANSSINQAFTNVLAAEQAGGNVTDLLYKLNSAGELLASAENSLRSGSKTNVAVDAQKAKAIANQVNDDAIALRAESLSASQVNFCLTLTFSVMGAVVFSLSLWLAWRWFKNRFINRLLGMKPKVVEDTP